MEGPALIQEAAFPAAPHGALYLLIYFPDCALTSLELLPPQSLQWLLEGRGLESLSSWCCEGEEGSLPHLMDAGKGWRSLLRSHLKLLQGSTHTQGTPWGRGER